MKRGFTLIEILGVVTIMGLFTLIIIPTTDTILDRQREKAYKVHVNEVKDALKLWGNMNTNSLPLLHGNEVEVTLKQLKKDGLIVDDFENPKTEKCYDNDNTFKIIKYKETYIYEVEELLDGDSSDCTI